MSITEQENGLFTGWAVSRPGFVSDGVADESSYLASDPKIMFVMKEAEDPGGGSWDLREYMRRGGGPKTWNNITRWVIGIRELEDDISWKILEEVSDQQRSGTLKAICVMNLKKTLAGHATHSPALGTIVQEDKDYLNQQFALYDADLVICCGAATSDLFHSVITFDPPPEWKTTKRGIWFHEYRPQKYIISYSHPEARVQDCLLFYGLMDAVREILWGQVKRRNANSVGGSDVSSR